MTPEQIDVSLTELSQALARAGDPLLIADFLKSILTEYELGEVTSRWALVKLLSEGVTQRSIARDLGLSLCKITRGSRELKKPDSSFARMLGRDHSES
jgi:TrpR family trp operon transcriptional repressor